jgi:hypothetical protein
MRENLSRSPKIIQTFAKFMRIVDGSWSGAESDAAECRKMQQRQIISDATA